MIKILFFIPGLSEGGAEKVLCNLVNNMDQSKFDITVQTIYPYEAEKYLVPGIHYKSIFRSVPKILKGIYDLWYRFCTEFKWTYPLYIKDNYDIEVAYLECGATKVIAGSTNKKAKKLAWVHCDIQKKGLTGKRIAGYYSKYDYTVCVSQDAKESFDNVFGDYVSSIVLRNVIDEEEIYQKSKEKIEWKVDCNTKKLLAVGRLSEEKNFGYLIETCKRLKKDGFRFFLNILGEGPLYDKLETQIIDNHLDDCISLKGFVSNPYPWIKEADYVICSSKYEGMSTVLQEALILDKVVITTPCAGMRELLGDSEYGYIVKDTTDGLYEGIALLLKNEELEMKYSEKARERSADFSKKCVVEQTQDWFDKLFVGK